MATIKNLAILKSSISYINNYYGKNVEKFEILEPLSVIINLAIISFMPTNTKIAIYQNRIHIQQPSLKQGIVRGIRGNNREEISYLLRPIIRFTQLYTLEEELDDDNEVCFHIKYIVSKALDGLSNLKKNYSTTSNVSHTIDLYINLLNKFLSFQQATTYSYENSKKFHDLNLSVQTKVNIQNIFKDVWDKDEIILISNLLKKIETDDKISNFKSIHSLLVSKQPYIDSIINHAKNLI